MRTATLFIAFVFVCWAAVPANAGGPLLVGGPNVGVSGQAFTWNPAAMPIQYRVDSGPMSTTAAGVVVIDNATGLKRLQAMLNVWQNVATAAVSFNNAGAIQATGSFTGGDVATADQFFDVWTSCTNGDQSPVVFDAAGSILTDLGMDPKAVIGFSTPCALDTNNGFIQTALVLLNGRFQDGVSTPKLSPDEFDEAITHELGHLLGLGHSQINVDVLQQSHGNCSLDEVAGLPLMFPFAHCQARATLGMPVLAPDDAAWISQLYPQTSTNADGSKKKFSDVYSTVSGVVFFSDGLNPTQDVNVVVRAADDPSTSQNESLRNAFSSVSGFLFTGNPGQSVTANYLKCSEADICPPNGTWGYNVGGDPFGSLDVKKIGYFSVPVPAGSYNVSVESVSPWFIGGSGVGPLVFPIAMPGSFNGAKAITVTAGTPTPDVNIILNGTPPSSDAFESRLRLPAIEIWVRDDEGGVA
jgi:hypothetical protein